MKHLRNILILAVIVAIGAGYYFTRGDTARLSLEETTGVEPVLSNVRKENFPTINVMKAEPWTKDGAPVPAKGFVVERFAEGLAHPRTIFRLPNGDILVAETNSPPRENKGIEGWVLRNLMEKAGADGVSANRISLLRDSDKDGKVDEKFAFLENLNSPFGIALIDDLLYVANTDAIYAYPYEEGATKIEDEGRKVANLNAKAPNNHWTRGLLARQDGKYLYVSVGSNSNIGENGMETEKERAAILQIELSTNKKSVYADGLRNPVGMAYLPGTDKFYTVVNERDMLGSDMVPDYLTEARWGAHYGWPWHFWGGYVDPRTEKNLDHRQYERRPDFGLGAHVAPLGLTFSHGQALGEPFHKGAIIARHGSWNRKPYSGYDVVYVDFDAKGEPVGKPKTLLSGFVNEADETASGRPTMVEFDQTGALLVSDDLSGIIWRVSKKGDPKPTAE